eukprot:jgi/Astpho2/3381/Aster-x1144
MQAADYLEAAHPGAHADRLCTVCYLPTTLVVLALMIRLHDRTDRQLRIQAGLAGYIAALVAVPVLDAMSGGSAPLGAVLALLVMVGVCDGLAQGAIFADASLMPPWATQAVVAGTASSGVLVSLLRIATKAALPATTAGLRASAAVYFTISAAICAACFAVYSFVLPRLPIVQQHRKQALHASPEVRPGPAGDTQRAQQATAVEAAEEGTAHSETEDKLLLAEASAGSSELQPAPGVAGSVPTLRVARTIWQPLTSVFVLYACTLSLFPGVLAEDLKSSLLGSWYPVLLIFLFNVADWTGKMLPARPELVLQSQSAILQACFLRLLFVPAFALAGSHSASPAVVSVLTLLLGLSNGYLTCVAMMGPSFMKLEPQEAQVAGNLMVLLLVAGLSLGALGGFAWLL